MLKFRRRRWKICLACVGITLLGIVYSHTSLDYQTLNADEFHVKPYSDKRNTSVEENSMNVVLSPDTVIIGKGLSLKSSHGGVGSKASMSTDLRASHNVVPFLSNQYVPRVLTPDRHQMLMQLMESVQQVFEQLQVRWTMAPKTLLGSFIMHDLLPWDDVMEVMVEESDFELVMKLQSDGRLLQKYGLGIDIVQGIHRIFFHSADTKGHRWAYLDVTLFSYNGKFVKHKGSNPSLKFQVPEEHFFPVHLRPLGGLWMRSPVEPWWLLSYIYGKKDTEFLCYTVTLQGTAKTRGSCQALQRDYPFVWREPFGEGRSTVETLTLNGEVMHSVLLAEKYHKNVNPYKWAFRNITKLF